MVWLQDPFKYLQGNHDVYFMDDMTAVRNCTFSILEYLFILIICWSWCCQIKPLNHSHGLPPSRNGVTYVCSCMIFLRCTSGAKLLLKKWVEEIRAQPWSNTEAKKPHDQPAFNRALHKTTHQVYNCFLYVPHLLICQDSFTQLMILKLWILKECVMTIGS